MVISTYYLVTMMGSLIWTIEIPALFWSFVCLSKILGNSIIRNPYHHFYVIKGSCLCLSLRMKFRLRICMDWLTTHSRSFPVHLTLFENYSKCRIWILAVSTNFCPIKTDLSGNPVWTQASGFQKLAKMDDFWHF